MINSTFFLKLGMIFDMPTNDFRESSVTYIYSLSYPCSTLLSLPPNHLECAVGRKLWICKTYPLSLVKVCSQIMSASSKFFNMFKNICGGDFTQN